MALRDAWECWEIATLAESAAKENSGVEHLRSEAYFLDWPVVQYSFRLLAHHHFHFGPEVQTWLLKLFVRIWGFQAHRRFQQDNSEPRAARPRSEYSWQLVHLPPPHARGGASSVEGHSPRASWQRQLLRVGIEAWPSRLAMERNVSAGEHAGARRLASARHPPDHEIPFQIEEHGRAEEGNRCLGSLAAFRAKRGAQ